MSTFKTLQSIPNVTKYAVFGYVRKMERKLSLLNIPQMIHYLILGYYFHGEYFEKSGDEQAIQEFLTRKCKIPNFFS